MKFTHDDHEHEVYLMDDGTLDTVIQLDGKEHRFSMDFVAELEYNREDTADMVKLIVELAKDACLFDDIEFDDSILDGDE